MNCRRNHSDQCGFDRIEDLLEDVLARLNRIEQKENHMSQQLDDLTQEVADVTTVEQSAIVLINGIAAQIAAAGVDPAKLSALSDQLKASSSALAQAVANAPAAPQGPPPVAQPPVTVA